jgi:hypothetical protein
MIDEGAGGQEASQHSPVHPLGRLQNAQEGGCTEKQAAEEGAVERRKRCTGWPQTQADHEQKDGKEERGAEGEEEGEGKEKTQSRCGLYSERPIYPLLLPLQTDPLPSSTGKARQSQPKEYRERERREFPPTPPLTFTPNSPLQMQQETNRESLLQIDSFV